MIKRWLHADGIWLAGIFLAALLTFQPALNNTIHFDDIYQVRTVAVPQGAAGWAHAAVAPWWPPDRAKTLWRPVTRLSILLQKALTGPEGRPFYAFNIALHGAVSLLLFLLARRLGWGALAAGLGALLFVVHPIHAEVVHQVVGRAESLAAFWMLAGLLLYLRYGLRDWRCWVLQPLCFALALGSKEHALVYPCLLVLLMLAEERMKSGQQTTHNTQHTISAFALLGLLMVVLGLFFAAKAAITGGVIEARSAVPYYENPLARMTLLQRLPAALGIFGHAASRLVWPAGLAPDYSAISFPYERGWGWAWSWAGLALLAATIVLAVRNARRGGRGWALTAAALGSYALISNGPFTIGTVMAERLWYWPSVPACLGLGWGLAVLYGRLGVARRRVGALALAAALLALLGVAWGDAPGWRSRGDQARATLARFPQSWRGLINLSAICYNGREYEEGYLHALEALRVMPREAWSWGWIACNATYLPGRQAEADRAFAQALALDPRLGVLHRRWATLLQMQGRQAEAAAHLREYNKLMNAADGQMGEMQ